MVEAGISLINSPHKKIKKHICSITLQIISQTDFAYLNSVISQKSICKVFFLSRTRENHLGGKKIQSSSYSPCSCWKIPWNDIGDTTLATARPSSLKSFASNTSREVVWSETFMTHDSTTPSSSSFPSGALTNTGSEGWLPGSSHLRISFVSTFSFPSWPNGSSGFGNKP